MTPSPDYVFAVRSAAAAAIAARQVKAAAEGDTPAVPGEDAGAAPTTLGEDVVDAGLSTWGGLKDTARQVTADSFGSSALVGAGIGAGAGLLRSLFTKGRRKRVLSDVLTGGLLGGTAGLGVQAVRSGLNLGQPDRSEADAAMADASARATGSRNNLGAIGVKPELADTLATGLVKKQLQPEEAKAQLAAERPGGWEQLRYSPRSAIEAVGRGDVSTALDQADVLGLKNLSDPSMLAASAGSNLLARVATSQRAKSVSDRLQAATVASVKLPSLPASAAAAGVKDWTALAAKPEAFRGLPPKAKREVLHAMKYLPGPSRGRAGRLTGGPVPALAALAPLISREWFTDKGYRSGNSDLFALAKAHRDGQAANAQKGEVPK
jgi:hypothetical protein